MSRRVSCSPSLLRDHFRRFRRYGLTAVRALDYARRAIMADAAALGRRVGDPDYRRQP
jgi:hypothetical protein